MSSERGAKEESTGSLDRRQFMRVLSVATTGMATLSAAKEGVAANGWAEATDQLSPQKLVAMYSSMLKCRLWEEAIKDAYISGSDDLYGGAHLYIGQEAIAIGVMAALNDDDFIASTHRGHGHLIAKGGDLNKMSAEIFFRKDGYNRGYGGSMHITDVSRGILGMNGIVGPSHILAAGAAYGIKVRGSKQVAVGFGGDGSVNNGWFYSALRNAALYRLPFISVIENNGFQVAIPATETISVRDLSVIGRGLEIPSYTVDGQDVFAVYSVARRAVERARSGEGPTLIEAKTYRFYDHGGMAQAKIGVNGAYGLPYRSDKELSVWIAKDPLPQFRTTLLRMGVLDEKRATGLERSVKKQVEESLEFARRSSVPRSEDGLLHVYATGAVEASQMADLGPSIGAL